LEMVPFFKKDPIRPAPYPQIDVSLIKWVYIPKDWVRKDSL